MNCNARLKALAFKALCKVQSPEGGGGVVGGGGGRAIEVLLTKHGGRVRVLGLVNNRNFNDISHERWKRERHI